jgi:hypothetical protein
MFRATTPRPFLKETPVKKALAVAAVLFVLVFALGTPIEASHGGFIPHCGDYCAVEGQGGGCIYPGGGGHYVRTTATCQNGQWTPS